MTVLGRASRDRRRGARGERAGDRLAREAGGIAVSQQGVLLAGPAAARLWAMETQDACAEQERVPAPAESTGEVVDAGTGCPCRCECGVFDRCVRTSRWRHETERSPTGSDLFDGAVQALRELRGRHAGQGRLAEQCIRELGPRRHRTADGKPQLRTPGVDRVLRSSEPNRDPAQRNPCGV
jgi:hypothetical protein